MLNQTEKGDADPGTDRFLGTLVQSGMPGVLTALRREERRFGKPGTSLVSYPTAPVMEVSEQA